MDNPYQSPEEPSTPFGASWPVDGSRRPRGLVNHVRAVAILMLIQGVLELCLSLVLGAVAAVIMPLASRGGMPQQQPGGPPPEQLFWFTICLYGGMAVVVLLAGVLHIAAGIRNLRFRGRTLGIVALGGGLLTICGCWCLPTALGLGVYGLIVYLNRSVSEAFRMGEAGCSSSEILNTFQL